MPTPKLLVDKQLKKRINENGARALNLFLKEPTVEGFMKVSRDFAESVGLISPNIRKILAVTDKNGIVCSQAMFGETIFAIVHQSLAPKLSEIFHRIAPNPHWIINAGISREGASVLEWRRQ
jgi:pantoate kinase